MCLNVSESLMRGKIKIANCCNNNISANSGCGGRGGDNDSESRYGYGYDYEYDRDRDNCDNNDADNDDCCNVNTTSDKLDDFQSHRCISNIVLKISGVWETEFEYGLTYKYYV